jgi:uncharacterized protein
VSRERRRARAPVVIPIVPESPEAPPPPPRPTVKRKRPVEARPFLLDFFPLESEAGTRLARFFDGLREGRLSTTRCARDDLVHWPPRTACPRCHTEELEWVDLPDRGRIYAFSAVLAGAPLGMEADVPFAVGLVVLEGVSLRLFGRIEGLPWNELEIGAPVRVEPYETEDGRVFYRFRATG